MSFFRFCLSFLLGLLVGNLAHRAGFSFWPELGFITIAIVLMTGYGAICALDERR